jgi:hypothetical protein
LSENRAKSVCALLRAVGVGIHIAVSIHSQPLPLKHVVAVFARCAVFIYRSFVRVFLCVFCVRGQSSVSATNAVTRVVVDVFFTRVFWRPCVCDIIADRVPIVRPRCVVTSAVGSTVSVFIIII